LPRLRLAAFLGLSLELGDLGLELRASTTADGACPQNARQIPRRKSMYS